MTEWTERQWACILQHNPDYVPSRLALGRSWLLKAQPSLARIESQDSDSEESFESCDSHLDWLTGPVNPHQARGLHDEEQQRTDRLDSGDYVQARDMLRAAIEQLDQALTVSYRTGNVTGNCLELAAEAYMHLGNATDPRINERSYQRALYLLRAASEIHGFSMDCHLETLFHENENYISGATRRWY